MQTSRQLAVIMFTDIVGYTALMGANELKGFELLRKNRELQKPIIKLFNGRFIKELGDGTLISFTTVTDAAYAAIKIQETCKAANDFQLRIGIHLGEVVFENDDIFGDGVNIASRIQTIAEPGGIYISESVYSNVSNKEGIETRFIKLETLKNVKDPVKIYEIIVNPISLREMNQTLLHLIPENSIAVLPFANMSGDAGQDFFSDGISEEIINTIAQVPNLKVAGRTSSFQFKGDKVDLREVGEKLKVSTVLEGSVRSSGNHIRITAQLIDVTNGYHLWSEKYDRVLNDVFEVQDEIARAIVERLKITMAGKPVEPKSREQTQNVIAYQQYLKGRELSYNRGKHLFEALICFQNALDIDPEYALAYAGLADANSVLCYYGLADPKSAWPKAIECAKLAFKYGPDLAESYNCNAAISMLHDWDWEKARSQYLKALELNPGYEQAQIWYGLFYLQMGLLKHDEGIHTIRVALETNPLSFYAYTNLGLALGIAGQFQEALEKAKRAAEMEPSSFLTQFSLALVYDWSGCYEETIQVLDFILKASNRHAWALSMLTTFYVKWSKKEKAEETYNELIAQSNQKYIQPAILAVAAAAIGNKKEALIFTHRAFVEHDPSILFVKEFPNSKALRSIPGFEEILKKMGL